MKIKDIDFNNTADNIKYGRLPEKESSEDISVLDLKRKRPFTWADPLLNTNIGLIDYNRFIIIAGEGASGKTTYTMQQALDNANNGHKVAYMSLEMGRKNLITNIARNKAGIEKQREFGSEVSISIPQQNVFNAEKDKLQSNKYLDIIGYNESLTIETFKNELDYLSDRYDLVFVDNLGMIERSKKESEVLPLLTEIILKARQKNRVSIIALHHMSKGSENQTGVRGKNAIRGSGKILDDADIIMTISRDDIGNTFSIVKDRDFGLIKQMRMIFDRGQFKSDIF